MTVACQPWQLRCSGCGQARPETATLAAALRDADRAGWYTGRHPRGAGLWHFCPACHTPSANGKVLLTVGEAS